MFIYNIFESIFYRVINVNKFNELYIKIRNAIIDEILKFRKIILDKYLIYNEFFFYKDRL